MSWGAKHADTARPGEAPRRRTQLHLGMWRDTARRVGREFKRDGLNDWAAALTYYAVLSIFPGLLVLVSCLGLFGQRTTDEVQHTITSATPGQVGQILDNAIDEIQANRASAGVVAVVGFLFAFWAASGYIAAFIRAANAIYDVPEGRPLWKTLRLRVGLTAVIGLILIASAVIVVFTGGVAERFGRLIGLGSTAVAVWNVAKWPVLVILIGLMLAILYWAAPNARQGGFRWVSPGGAVAVVVWLVVSGGFAVYVANFASYNKTYGTIAGGVVFLVWLWLTNIAILLGAEVDAELERGRAIAAGHGADNDSYLELRDDQAIKRSRPFGTRAE
jgi:membrane protein